MNSIKSLVLPFMISGFVLFAFACSHSHDGHSHDGAGEATTEQTTPHGHGKEYTSAYVCPMHCDGSGSDAAGQCPACGMDYVALADHVRDGHEHHEGHSH